VTYCIQGELKRDKILGPDYHANAAKYTGDLQVFGAGTQRILWNVLVMCILKCFLV